MSDRKNKFEEENRIKSEHASFQKYQKDKYEKIKDVEIELSKFKEALKEIDKDIQSSEQLLAELDEIALQSQYFADAEQLKSIGVKNAAELASQFKVLGRKAKTKEKQLNTSIIDWHASRIKGKEELERLIRNYTEDIAEIKADIAAEKKKFEKYILDSTEDKSHAQEILDITETTVKRVAIVMHINTDEGKNKKVNTYFKIQKEGDKLSILNQKTEAYDKGFIKNIEMKFSTDEFSIGKNDLNLRWKVQLANIETSTGESRNETNTTGSEETESDTDGKEASLSATTEAKIPLAGGTELEASGTLKHEHVWSETTKKEKAVGRENSSGKVIKLENLTIEGDIAYRITSQNGLLAIVPSGKQKGSAQYWNVSIDSSSLVKAFN